MIEVILLSLVGGIISLIGGVLLLSSKKNAQKLAFYATPFAAGALLSASLIDLLPDAIHEAESTGISLESLFVAVLSGILVFFLLERVLRWFHHHHEHRGAPEPVTTLVIVGDTLHNALDGIAIAASFLISPATGIVTTMAVAAHEIPQEIGDFGVMLSRGVRRRTIILANLFSALATVFAAVVTYALGSTERLPLPILLALTAGFFLYIALSDIVPTIHEPHPKGGRRDIRPFLLILGVIFVGFGSSIAHKYIEAGELSQESHVAQK